MRCEEGGVSFVSAVKERMFVLVFLRDVLGAWSWQRDGASQGGVR